MNIFVFIAAAVLSLPKQFITVYIGSVLEDENNGQLPYCTRKNDNEPFFITIGSSSVKTERKITFIVLAITIIVTVVAMRYLRGEMEKVKHEVIYARRKHRFVPFCELLAQTYRIQCSVLTGKLDCTALLFMKLQRRRLVDRRDMIADQNLCLHHSPRTTLPFSIRLHHIPQSPTSTHPPHGEPTIPSRRTAHPGDNLTRLSLSRSS